MKLHIDSKEKIDFLICFILQQDFNIILLSELMFERYDTMNDYMRAHFLTEHTMTHSCKKINQLLQKFSLKIDKKKFQIVGTEINLRLFMQQFCWYIHRDDIWTTYFSSYDFKQVSSDLTETMELMGISTTNSIKVEKIIFIFVISLIRNHKNKSLILSEEIRKNIPVSILYDNESITQLLNQYHIDSPYEDYFLLFNLISSSLAYNSTTIKKHLYLHHRKMGSPIFLATKQFIHIFQKKITKIPNRDIENYFDFIFRSHLKAFVNKELGIKFTFETLNLAKNTRFNRNYYTSEVLKLMNELEKNEKFLSYFEKDYLFERYLMLILALNLEPSLNNSIKIYLNTEFSPIYEKHIRNYINNTFKYKYDIHFIENNYTLDPDIVLESQKSNEKIKDNVIEISYPISQREIHKIETYIENYLLVQI